SRPAAWRTASSRKRWPTRHPTAWWTGWKNWLTGWSAPREKNESSSRHYRARHRHLLVQRLQDAAAIYRRAGVSKLPELVRPGKMGACGRPERTRIADVAQDSQSAASRLLGTRFVSTHAKRPEESGRGRES